MTDHYKKARQLLDGLARSDLPHEDRMAMILAAQVHATLATVGVTGEANSVTIPWPPTDELVERVAQFLATRFGSGTNAWSIYLGDARAVLGVIGGGNG